MENLSIRFWAEDDRPREKMIHKGRHSLSNSELLAIILGTGTRKKSAVELAQEILMAANNNLRELSRFSKHDFIKFDGVGDAKAVSILAALELARRREDETPSEKVQITNSKLAYQQIRGKLADLYHEEFHILFLSTSNTVIASECISKGGFDKTIVDKRMIFKKAIDHCANGIILAHNHPSGNLNASELDKQLTKVIMTSAQILEIKIIDHLIITSTGYLSFADEGLLY